MKYYRLMTLLLSTSIFRYLQGLEQLQVPKPIKEELGGGTKEFTLNEVRLLKFKRECRN